MHQYFGIAIRTACAVIVCLVPSAHAQPLPAGYPNKPIRMLLGVAPGSGLDNITRIVATKLGEKWGRPVIVDNRMGANGIIALESIAHAAPDGYTFYSGATQIMGAWPLKQVAFDPRKVLDPVVQMYSSPYILVVHPSVQARSVGEFIATAKSKRGELSYGSSGVGSAGHLSMEIFKAKTGIDMVHVPYKGVVISMTDLMSGQIQALLSSVVSILPHVRSGKVRAIAVAQLEHTPTIPDLPTIAESGIPALRNFEMGVFGGIYAPAGVPLAIQVRMHHDVSEILQTPEIKKNYEASGGEIAPSHTRTQFKQKVVRQITDIEELVKTAGMKDLLQ